MSSEGNSVTRRYMLQTLGATGSAAVAGCIGGGSDEPDSEETPVDEGEDSNPEPTTEEPTYELPESEHVDTAEFFKDLIILPPGEEYAGASYSPSKLHENYDTTFMGVLDTDNAYDKFDFSDEDIPESFVEEKPVGYYPKVKVDQLPNNVSEGDVVQQLQEDGYSKDREIGNFEVYTTRGGKYLHAVGNERHFVSWSSSDSQERANGMMDSVLEQEVEEQLTLGVDIEEVIDALNVQDSLTMTKQDSLLPIDPDYQPEISVSSVDFEEGTKYAAWVFEDEQAAGTAYNLLQNEDSFNSYESLEKEGRFVTAAKGDYNPAEINAAPLLISDTGY